MFRSIVATTLVILLSTSTTIAAPTIRYDLMDQQPPVARVGREFVFNLFPDSFTSNGNITYTPSGMPSWLSWNTPSLAFHGTPAATNVGESIVTLAAADSAGSITTNFTLIVTNNSVPAVHQSFTSQIGDPPSRQFASATTMPGGTGVSVPPYWSFALGWASDTFRLSRTEPINGNLFMSARQRGMDRLPSWLTFNNDTMTFNGVAPADGTYTIVVTGTDYWGYTGAQTSFVIEVGVGSPIELLRSANLSNIVTMARSKVDYDLDLSSFRYGGQPIRDGQVQVAVNSTEFPWLSVQGTALSGTAPDNLMNGTVASLPIPITVSSTNVSSTLYLETWVSLDAIPYFFTTFSLPNATINPGSFYEFDLTPFVADPDATLNVTVNPLEAAQWLSFHSNKTLSGLAPKNLEYPNVDVVFQASKANLVASNNLLISMNGVTTQGGTNGTAPVPNVSTGGGLSQGAKIGLGVGLGLLGLLLLLLLLFCCCRRRKRSEKTVNDNDSFVGGSDGDPFRKSGRLETTRNFFPNFYSHTDRREDLTPENVEKPTRMDGLRSIFGMSADMSNTKEIKPGDIFTPQLTQSSSSFIAHGDVIGVADPIRSPSRASSFTESMGSSDSRASWESRESFNWSSGENDMPPLTHSKRSSNAPSIPRPRQDFTPRYPRNNSPTRLAALGASQHSLGSPPQGGSSSEGEEHSGIFSSGSLSTDSRFASGPNGLNRFGGSGFKSIDEEDEDSASAEGPAIVAMAERQSLETRRPTERPTPRLRPSKEKITSATDQVDASSSRHALTEMDGEEGMYDDAEEYRRSLMGQYEGDEVHGLGYPASTIYFGTPNPDRSSYNPSEARSSTITAIPPHERVTSPPLPSVGSFKRQSVPPLNVRPSSSSDGRVLACANETFSIHPQIHPPPSVSLSAATWSSAGPSTYRAEVEGGGQLPTWLHFDARELELWGVPSLNNSGEVTIIKIIEKLPKDKRKSDPTAFGYEPQQERVVGRMVLEVVDRVRSPQFSLENSPHAF